MKTSGIYCIKNASNERVYVGSAVCMDARWSAHRHHLTKGTHHSVALQRAWHKHGAEVFVFEVLETVENRTELLLREQYWLDKLGGFDPKRGYNMRTYVASQLGTKRSPESRAKMSASAKARDPNSWKHKTPRTPWNKGKTMSEEYCKNAGDRQRGKKRGPRSPETRAKVGAANKGRPSPFKGQPRDPNIIRRSVATKARKRDERRREEATL